jgi:hypothetical protein
MKRLTLLAVATVCVLVTFAPTRAMAIADILPDWSAGWPNTPFADGAGGGWVPYVVNGDASFVSPLGADSWVHPLHNVSVHSYDMIGGNNTPDGPALTLFEGYGVAALPWNTGGQTPASEYKVALAWISGVSGTVQISGFFKYLGDQQSSVMVTSSTALVPETLLLPATAGTTQDASSLVFNFSTDVSVGSQIWFIVGTGNTQYSGWDDETLFDVHIVPEPATCSLLLAGIALFRMRGRHRTV